MKTLIQKTIHILNSIPKQSTNFGNTYELVSEIEKAQNALIQKHASINEMLSMHDHMQDDPDTDLNHLSIEVIQLYPVYLELSNALSIEIDKDFTQLFEDSRSRLLESCGITEQN